VIAWSGDNPCSLVGTGVVHEGEVAISLGTSDTVFAAMSKARIDPSGAAHVFGSPTGEYMGLTCFRNGSLARERVRDEFGLDWPGFSAALRHTAPGNGGAMMLPWFEPEITPHVASPGIHRHHLDPTDGAAGVRAIVEAQMMAVALHSEWMGVTIDRIHATGGAALNEEILRVMADVFDADVYTMPVRNSASLGAALRAFHADRLAEGHPIAWDDVTTGFAQPDPLTRVRPIPAHVRVYGELKKRYGAFEAEALAGFAR
jgi:xylulokinase